METACNRVALVTLRLSKRGVEFDLAELGRAEA